MPRPRALISVSDKSNVEMFARELDRLGFELVSTGGTARALVAAGLPVTPVTDVTGTPEMLDGRVKTLHPAIHAGILARRRRSEDLAALARQGIQPIDVVAVNLYPFVRAAAEADRPAESLLEEIDIGGPCLVRAAAKSFRDVSVVVDPADYQELLGQLGQPGGPTLEYRLSLARKAFAHTAAYDGTIAATLEQFGSQDGDLHRLSMSASELPERLRLEWTKVRDLRYGENPHQAAAWYSGRDDGADGLSPIQGKALSFINVLDLDAAARIVQEFDEPAAAVIKHTNPSGVAIGSTLVEAYTRAREADALSAFGGIVGLNRPIDVETARAITSTFIEAVVAPAVDPLARAVLTIKPNMRVVLAAPNRDWELDDLRSAFGGALVQLRDRLTEASSAWSGSSSDVRVVTRRSPTEPEWGALRFAWRVCAHVKSNAVVFATALQTVAVGAGQMSRVDAVNVATMKAAGRLTGTVCASDAFFPFRDGADAIAASGATAIVQPGGSVRDAEVIAAADEHGLAMIFTGRRHFRH